MKLSEEGELIEDFTEEEREAFAEVANTRRPVNFYRGKTLTKEQLIQLFLNEEPCLRNWDSNGNDLAKKCYFDNRTYYGMIGCCLQRKSFGWETSCVLSDGTIYGSALASKYPEWNEYVPDWQEFAKRNDFVDMVVSYTDLNEWPCYWCELINYKKDRAKKQADKCDCNWSLKYDGLCLAKLDKTFCDMAYDLNREEEMRWLLKQEYKTTYKDFTPYAKEFLERQHFALAPFNYHKSVMVTLHIHDGVVDILVGEKAQKKFLEYDTLYGDFRMSIVNDSYFFGTKTWNKAIGRVHFSNAFMRECCGRICSEDLWDNVIVPKYMQPFKDEDVVIVTKDWLIEQYNKAFGNTSWNIENIKNYISSLQ